MPSPGLPVHQKAHPSQEQVTGRACLSLRESRVPPKLPKALPYPHPNEQTVTDSFGGTWPGSRIRHFLPPFVCLGVLGSEGGGFLPVVMEMAASLLSVWILSSVEGGEQPRWAAAAVTDSAAQHWQGPEGLSCF